MTKEQLADEYRDIHMDKFDLTKAQHLPFQYNDGNKIENAFVAGFLAKEKIIKETLQSLNQLIGEINNLPLTEQIFNVLRQKL